MSQHNFLGVDISKNKFDVCLFNTKKSAHQIFANDQKGFEHFFKWIKKTIQNPWVIMEATGHYNEPLANFLYQQKVCVSVVNPFQIKHFAKAKLSRNKNDKADAKVIAHYGSVMKPRHYEPRPAEQKEVRERIQLIDTLKDQSIQLQNQLDSIQTKSVKKDLQNTLTDLKKRIKQLEEVVEKEMESNEASANFVKLITSIKGVGNTTAYRLLAYLPNLSQFNSAKQLAAFVGVSPSQKQSGKYVGQTSLSKGGDSRLRKALYMPALCVKRFNKYFEPFVTRLEKNGLKPKAIVGALMRKLVHIIFGMIKSNQPFNPKLV